VVSVVAVVAVVLLDEESPFVETLGFDEEHAPPTRARATTHPASAAR
jgi:hypothetical protein